MIRAVAKEEWRKRVAFAVDSRYAELSIEPESVPQAMDVSQYLALSVFVLVCMATASSGAYFKPDAWYEGIAKPWWNPPKWLFAPAWSVFYALLAVSGWLVWKNAPEGAATMPMVAFGVHCVLNALWSALFFGARRMDWAFYEALALWASVVLLIVLFVPISATAAWLLAPYLLWVSFASFLNFTVWKLNAGTG